MRTWFVYLRDFVSLSYQGGFVVPGVNEEQARENAHRFFAPLVAGRLLSVTSLWTCVELSS